MKIITKNHRASTIGLISAILIVGCLPKKNAGKDADASSSKSIDAIMSDSNESQNKNPIHCGPKTKDNPFDGETAEQSLELQRQSIPEFIKKTFTERTDPGKKESGDYSFELLDDPVTPCKDILAKRAEKLGFKVDADAIRSNGCIDLDAMKIILPKQEPQRIHQITLPLVWELYSAVYIEFLTLAVPKLPADDSKLNANDKKDYAFIKSAQPLLTDLENSLAKISEDVLEKPELKGRKQMLHDKLIPKTDPTNMKILNRFYTSEIFHSYYCSADSQTQLVNSPFSEAYNRIAAVQEALGKPLSLQKK